MQNDKEEIGDTFGLESSNVLYHIAPQEVMHYSQFTTQGNKMEQQDVPLDLGIGTHTTTTDTHLSEDTCSKATSLSFDSANFDLWSLGTEEFSNMFTTLQDQLYPSLGSNLDPGVPQPQYGSSLSYGTSPDFTLDSMVDMQNSDYLVEDFFLNANYLYHDTVILKSVSPLIPSPVPNIPLPVPHIPLPVVMTAPPTSPPSMYTNISVSGASKGSYCQVGSTTEQPDKARCHTAH
ncbi:hypothetical protein BDR04DRAFT_1120913 [Suillus decipiens]|nr:hypothetical protein BDR04DRAFT_1120913 [Suillus decipiens]